MLKELLQDKVILIILAMTLILIFVLIYAGVQLTQRTDACNERGGVMVKASPGYVCIDKSVLK